MFKNQKDQNITFDEVKNIINSYCEKTLSIAQLIKFDMDQLDEMSANILFISLLGLNNAMDDFFSRLYYFQHHELSSFYQYLHNLKSLGLSNKKIYWIKELREYRNVFAHAIDIKNIVKEVFSNRLKISRFVIVVENAVNTAKDYFNFAEDMFAA